MSTDNPVVWYGGIGHRLLGVDSGDQCFRCGMSADEMPTELESLIPDCAGPSGRQEHHWQASAADAIECAYGDGARVTAESTGAVPEHTEGRA